MSRPLQRRISRLSDKSLVTNWQAAYDARERIRRGVLRLLTGEVRDPAKRSDPVQSRRDGDLLRRFEAAGGTFPAGEASPAGDEILAKLKALRDAWSPEDWTGFCEDLHRSNQQASAERSRR